jgi:cytochrome c-type biogenesis protein CcmF
MPWLAGTALVHSTLVMEKRDALKVWTILLAILTFSLSLIGTFLVRSGILTSVHSFAIDPARGIFILAILAAFVGGSLALFAWRAPMLQQGGVFAPVSREAALVLNNLFLTTGCATVFVGTLYPLALEAFTGARISVGAPFFNATFLPLVIPLLLMVPLGQTLAWKRGDLLAAAQRLYLAFGIAVLASILMLAATVGGPVAAPLGVGLGVFLVLGSLNEVVTRCWRPGTTPAAALARARGLPRSTWGTAIAHTGVGVTVIGIAASAWSVEGLGVLRPGERLRAGSYEVRLEGVAARAGTTYRESVVTLKVFHDGEEVGVMQPSRRLYTTRNMPTTEAAILTRFVSQLYASANEVRADGSVSLRLDFKPLIALIWLGALVMALGAALSLTDRRLRVGAPARARAVAAMAPAE